MLNEIQGDLRAPNGKIAIAASRFNETIVDLLIKGAIQTLIQHGVRSENIDVVRVPGAFELPLICQQLAAQSRYSGVLALGCVIRGATTHYDYVAGQCASGLMNVALATHKPVMFGVLTCETIEQAMERSGTKAGNKGRETATALIEMANLIGAINE